MGGALGTLCFHGDSGLGLLRVVESVWEHACVISLAKKNFGDEGNKRTKLAAVRKGEARIKDVLERLDMQSPNEVG
jgi:hypothetical protein